MKKLLTLSCLLIFTFLASSAQNAYQVTVLGSLTHPDGTGVASQDVNLSSDTSFFGTWTYSNTVTTDAGGIFTDTISVPDTDPFGILLAETADCNGGSSVGIGFFEMNMTEVIIDLFYCDTINPPPFDSCFADVHCDPAGNLVATAYGTAPFTYLWNTGEITETIMPQDTGTYCVTITDAEGCTAEACSHYVGGGNIGDSCFVFIFEDFTAAGNIGLIAQGFGQDPVVYIWDTGDTTQSIIPTADGTYCVTAIDAAGCAATACYDYISKPWGNDTCGLFIYCDPNGVFVADAWGEAPFTYAWSTGETTPTIMPQDTGTYCVTVTDASGCVADGCYYFGGIGTPDSCFAFVAMGPTGDLTAVGLGLPPFVYLWDTGDTTEVLMVMDSLDHCVTITDAAGCVATACSDGIDPWNNCQVTMEETAAGLTAVIDNPQNYSFLWHTGETTQTIQPTVTGLYCVTATALDGSCVTESCYFWFDGNNGDSTCAVVLLPINDTIVGGNGYFALGTGVEPLVYTWDTGETTPFILNDGTNRCVTITDATGCVAIACSDDINNGPQSSNVSGYIYTVDSTQFPVFVDGTVELIDAITGTVTATTQVVNLNNLPFYDFGDVADGTYILRAMVSKANGDAYIPTYHFSTTLNSEADEIQVPYAANPIFNAGFDILVFESQRRPGKGSISGNVTKERRFAQAGVAEKGDVEGLSIILFDDSNQPIGYYPTDSEGNFVFPELAFGTYTVYIDVPGHNNAHFTVTLHEDAPNTSGLNFDIDDKEIIATSNPSSAEDLKSISSFRIFPNPASGNVNIEVAAMENRDMELRLQNISGITMITRNLSLSQASQRVRLDLENLTGGIYFVRLIDGEQSVAKKLIIK